MQASKSIKNFINYFLGPVLFAWLLSSIYWQVRSQPHLEQSWAQISQSLQSVQILYLAVALLLIPVNWGLEARKWQLSVRAIQAISFMHAFKAVLSGVSFSVTMPNRVGEYLGRVLYLPEGSRLMTISSTLVGSFAQLLTTLLMGELGLIILKEDLLTAYPQLVIWYQFLVYGLAILIVVLLLLYFNVAGAVHLFRRWIHNERYTYLVTALSAFDKALLRKVLLLSMARYAVFILQYWLVFRLFEVNAATLTIAWVMSLVFLAMAIVPSIALVELGLRGEITLRLMGMFSVNGLGISLASITVWFINLVLPALIGSVLMLNLRVFRSKA